MTSSDSSVAEPALPVLSGVEGSEAEKFLQNDNTLVTRLPRVDYVNPRNDMGSWRSFAPLRMTTIKPSLVADRIFSLANKKAGDKLPHYMCGLGSAPTD
jgi:hypothetical protein